MRRREAQPLGDLRRLQRRVVGGEPERLRRPRVRGRHHPRVGVQRPQPGGQRRGGGRRGEVGLGDQDQVGGRGLAARFLEAVERRVAGRRVDQRHHPVQDVAVDDQVVAHQRVQHRGGVGEAGGLDHQPAEGGSPAGRRVLGQPQQRQSHVAGDGAAQAARGHGEGALVRRLDQGGVDPDGAELVHDHRRVAEAGLGDQPVEQGGLAGAEEAGQHRHRDAVWRRSVAQGLVSPLELVREIRRRGRFVTPPRRRRRPAGAKPHGCSTRAELSKILYLNDNPRRVNEVETSVNRAIRRRVRPAGRGRRRGRRPGRAAARGRARGRGRARRRAGRASRCGSARPRSGSRPAAARTAAR